MKTIALNSQYETMVDDDDYEWLCAYKWFVCPGRKTLYAGRNQTISRGKRITLLIHRLVIGAQAGQIVDHIDRNGLNNCKSNLRICTSSQNSANKSQRRISSSPYKGVFPDRGAEKWRASIEKDNRNFHLGMFQCAEEAARHYDIAALSLYGEYAFTNFPSSDYTQEEIQSWVPKEKRDRGLPIGIRQSKNGRSYVAEYTKRIAGRMSKKIWVGTFATVEDALKARNSAINNDIGSQES